MNDLQQTVAELSRRVQAVEDELAIHRLIVQYGFGVDVGAADRAAEVFTEDAIYDTDVGVMHGHAGVRGMVLGAHHQAMVGTCAHQIGPAVVELHGDRAVATGYSRVYVRTDDTIRIYRVSFNRWELERRDGRWQIAQRTTRLLGHPEAKRIFETDGF